jgi:hypothetical protein
MTPVAYYLFGNDKRRLTDGRSAQQDGGQVSLSPNVFVGDCGADNFQIADNEMSSC